MACGGAAAELGGSVAVTTDYVFRGLSQSGHEPALQGDLHVKTSAGWFAGAWGSVVDSPPALVAPNEVNLYLGRAWRLGSDWSASVHYARYLYPSDPRPVDYDHDELQATIGFQDRAAVSVGLAPRMGRYTLYEGMRHGRQWSFEASLRQPLWRGLSLIAGAGHYDLGDVAGLSYRGWSGGLEVDAGRMQFTLSRFGVDGAARRMFGAQAAHGRWTLTATWRLR
jgi:uncharacterized protein (TIGR02001 family)